MIKNLPVYTPDYVLDEYISYICKISLYNSAEATYQNIFALINLAKVNNRITEQQAHKLKEIIKYNKQFIKPIDLENDKIKFDEMIKNVLNIINKKV